jgi:hypothetical protein
MRVEGSSLDVLLLRLMRNTLPVYPPEYVPVLLLGDSCCLDDTSFFQLLPFTSSPLGAS